MKAWMPGEASYITCKIELSVISEDIFQEWRPWLLGYVTEELKGAPDEWRWELDDGVVELTAARAT